MGNSSRVLVIDTGDLTDFLFHVPLLQGVRNRYPGARMDFLLPEEHSPLVVPSGLARQCLVYSEKQMRPWAPAFATLLRGLRKNKYDVAIVMSLTPQPNFELVALASGAALRCGPSHQSAYPSLNFEMRAQDGSDGYLGRLPAMAAVFLGLPQDSLPRCWPLPEDKLRQMQQLVHFNKPRQDEWLVGVDPGLGKAGHGISLKNLHFLVRQLSSQATCRILPLSDPSNADRLRRFEAQLADVQPGLPRDTLLETTLLLAQCNLFVASNSDLFHFAVAQQVPTIGLFTPHDGPEWDPGTQPRVRILRVASGQRVDIDTLMEAVEAVTSGRAAGLAAKTPDPAHVSEHH